MKPSKSTRLAFCFALVMPALLSGLPTQAAEPTPQAKTNAKAATPTDSPFSRAMRDPVVQKKAKSAADKRIAELRKSTDEAINARKSKMTPESFRQVQADMLKSRAQIEKQILAEEQLKAASAAAHLPAPKKAPSH